MEEILHLTEGKGRTKVSLSVFYMGKDIIVCIYNNNSHTGALGIGEYDRKEKRVSVSVITRCGHKDDAIAYKAAYLISKHFKGPCCVIAGVHVDGITRTEIDRILINTETAVRNLLTHLDMKLTDQEMQNI